MKVMHKYEVIIYWSDDDDCFISEVPELEGCMSDGKTYKEVMAHTEIIIEEWIEIAKEKGWAIPEPKKRKVLV